MGTEYDVVKNLCNDQEYVVANATGSTHTAGQVVPLGSFTGNPGEFTFGRPPAGYGGASAYNIRKAKAGYGSAAPEGPPVDEGTRFLYASYDPSGDKTYFLGYTFNDTPPDGWETRWVFYRAAQPRAARNASDAGEFLFAIPRTGYDIHNFSALSGGKFYVAGLTTDTPSDPNGAIYSMRVYRNDGELLASSDEELDSLGLTYQQPVVTSSNIICIEGSATPVSHTGPPYPSHKRIVKRSISDLSVVNSYEFPSVSPFNAATSRGQFPIYAFRRPSGGVGVYFLEVGPSPGLIQTLYVRKLSDSLGFVSDTIFAPLGISDLPIYDTESSCAQVSPSSFYAFAYDDANSTYCVVEIDSEALTASVLFSIPYDLGSGRGRNLFAVGGGELSRVSAVSEFLSGSSDGWLTTLIDEDGEEVPSSWV